MGKDPAILFYTSDFLSGTLTMSNEHTGMYIKLLCLQHQKGRLKEADMLYICRTYVEDVYLKFKKENGFYYNERMEFEAKKRRNYSESRKKNVLNRYKKKSKKKSTYVLHMENENEDVNRDVIRDNKNIKDAEFISFLKANPAYSHIDIDTELGKMDAWLITRPGRKKSKRFVLNWLNKIEKPLNNSLEAEDEFDRKWKVRK